MRVGIENAFKHGAAQLPPGMPGIFAIHTGFKGPITPTDGLERLVHQGKNTRVAAVVLIRESIEGRSIRLDAFTHLHPKPSMPLPAWLQRRLAPSIGAWTGGWLGLT